MVADVAALRRAGEALARQLAPTSLYRWFDMQSLTVDRAADVAVMHLYEPWPAQQEQAWANALVATRLVQSVYVKRRPKEARHVANTDLSSVAPVLPLAGPSCDSLLANEGGLQFEIRPSNGLSIGCYVDSRDARAWVRANASGSSVLNLFAYTCGFGLAAWAGGATGVLNVDLSRKVLDWGHANARQNGFECAVQDFVAGDSFDWLERLEKKQRRFGLVVLDPPGFASAGKRRFSAVKDYGALAAQAARAVEPGGRLLALCNVKSLTDEAFDGQLRRALGAEWQQEASFGASRIDCPLAALKCRVWRSARR